MLNPTPEPEPDPDTPSDMELDPPATAQERRRAFRDRIRQIERVADNEMSMGRKGGLRMVLLCKQIEILKYRCFLADESNSSGRLVSPYMEWYLTGANANKGATVGLASPNAP